ncbi:hypothetical protein F1559_002721 [Cyanidiococcus yangmingshanensis]|uniref:Uncharacterized protein n=1 Tax=Cyanidiococcus yangmingshanensis TaxID=2690220 RepID=A0A7J7IDB4_9RHOD|nr:hypothetical protein F1559_002721 [Cyanidiococcus yangmingshanensis]
MDTSSTSSFSDDDVDDDDHGDEESRRRQRQVILACEEHARQGFGAADRAEERVLVGRSLSWRMQAEALWLRLSADLYDEQELIHGSSNENDTFSKVAENKLQKTQPLAEQFGQFRLWSDEPRQVPAGILRERVEERLRRARCAHVLRHMDGPVGYDTPQAWGLSASLSGCIPSADIEVDAQGFVVHSFADTLPARYRDTRRGPKLRFSTRGHEAPHQKN